MRIVAKGVKLDMLSPHLFRLYIVWENGIAVRPDVALLWRGITPNNSEAWTEEEDEMMRLYYPDKPQIKIMQRYHDGHGTEYLSEGKCSNYNTILFLLSFQRPPT